MIPRYQLTLFLLLLGVCPAPAAWSQSNVESITLGRLFFTPMERRLIEANPEAPLEPGQHDTPIRRQGNHQIGTRMINGALLRPNGKHTVWINGQAISYQGNYSSRNEYRIGVSGDTGETPVITGKPGQIINSRNGITQDPFTPMNASKQVPKPEVK